MEKIADIKVQYSFYFIPSRILTFHRTELTHIQHGDLDQCLELLQNTL